MPSHAITDVATVTISEIAVMLGACEKTTRRYLQTKRLNLEPVRSIGGNRYDLNEVRKAIDNFKAPRTGPRAKTAN